jgi:hypothetical protein
VTSWVQSPALVVEGRFCGHWNFLSFSRVKQLSSDFYSLLALLPLTDSLEFLLFKRNLPIPPRLGCMLLWVSIVLSTYLTHEASASRIIYEPSRTDTWYSQEMILSIAYNRSLILVGYRDGILPVSFSLSLVVLGNELRDLPLLSVYALPLEPCPQSFCFQFVFQIRSQVLLWLASDFKPPTSASLGLHCVSLCICRHRL